MNKFLIAVLMICLGGCTAQKRSTNSQTSKDRLSTFAKQRSAVVANNAISFADENPTDIRSNRKAIDLAQRAFAKVPDWSDKRVDAIAVRLSTPEFLCSSASDSVRYYTQFARNDEARSLGEEIVQRCASGREFYRYARMAKKTNRCAEAVKLGEKIWPRLTDESQIQVLDGINHCSTDLTFAKNTAFLSPDVVNGYIFLLKKRERQRASDRCEQRCVDAVNQCQLSCFYSDCGCGVSQAYCLAGCR